VFYATGRTALYRNIGIVNTIIGLLFSYILLAPKTVGGADLGSAGIAYKMVVVQVVAINVQLWYNCRWLNVSFKWILSHQFLVLMVFGLVATCARAVGSLGGPTPLGEFILSGFVYGLLAVAACWFSPKLVGITRGDLLWVRIRAEEFFANRSKPTAS
jgi:hypothetical protein